MAALLVMPGQLAFERVQGGVHGVAQLLFLLVGAKRAAGAGGDDRDLFQAVLVVPSMLQRDVHADQLRIALAKPSEALVDEGAPFRLHRDLPGLDLDVHVMCCCNSRTAPARAAGDGRLPERRRDADEAERAVRTVFRELQRLLGSPTGQEGEARDVLDQLPKDLKKLWLAAAEKRS